VRLRVCVSLEQAPGGSSSAYLVRLCVSDSPCLWLPQPALQLACGKLPGVWQNPQRVPTAHPKIISHPASFVPSGQLKSVRA